MTKKVLVDKAHYEALLETLEILHNRKDVKALKKSIDAYRRGEGVRIA